MKQALVVLLLLAVGAYVAACLALFFLQRSLIYYPPPVAAYAAPKNSILAVDGARVLVSERPLAGEQALIYLGGNAEDVTGSLPILERAFPGRALYLLHYRGYTGSTGNPSEQTLVGDALALFDRVAREHRDVVLIGRSLGTGVAVQVASQRPVGKLVLVTPYDSLAGLAARQFPYFPVRWLLRDRYASSAYAPRVQAPTLLIAAQHDEIIPADSAERLLARFPAGVARLRVIEGTQHNSISEHPDYIPSLQWAK
ncbi:alpha/beta hydrolase [Massilia sp. LC238]|uniref:alpha/beta hydrolase n=1 Tax=Massilia sp. LC238 TaxID=1502852 RepID=UPI0004E3650D|nr:PhoP family transcriptional regulator [Massilia sp. LC238]KFC71913.1 Hydrolase of the alpha/beta superfamily protein [Massilia sp. LC238]